MTQPGNCSQCFFWEQWKNQPHAEEVRGECHARAPYLVDKAGSTKTRWPSTVGSVSCGNFISRTLTRRNLWGVPIPVGIAPVATEVLPPDLQT